MNGCLNSDAFFTAFVSLFFNIRILHHLRNHNLKNDNNLILFIIVTNRWCFEMKNRIKRLIEMTLTTCFPWIERKDGVVQFVDPLDKKEISAHYGVTHMAVALIIYGNIKNDSELISKGEELLFSIFERWDNSKALPDFHNDFNNFSLCVLDNFTDNYHEKITSAVLDTEDTFFDTVNWLPMRWYVNRSRYNWTHDDAYLEKCKVCAKKIKEATYSDGFIDDMIPKGRSFSLQYDIATVAFMQFLRTAGEDLDLSKETGALLNAVCPDGDINYFGRGTNQIFAWSLWIYLLSSSGLSELNRALDYLENRLADMLAKNNIMLNDYSGEEKYMWWDYHYCSVYTAHLLFWLVMALKDYDKMNIEPVLVEDGSSGVHIYRNSNAFVAAFEGRTEYLAEAGPAIEAVWTKRSGTVCKGTFGPWYGLFGNKYIQADAALKNFLGLNEIKTGRRDPIFRSFISKINLKKKQRSLTEKLCFIKPDVSCSDGVRIIYHPDKLPVLLNLPSFNGEIHVKTDGNEVELSDSMQIRNQYGWLKIKQKIIESCDEIEILII